MKWVMSNFKKIHKEYFNSGHPHYCLKEFHRSENYLLMLMLMASLNLQITDHLEENRNLIAFNDDSVMFVLKRLQNKLQFIYHFPLYFYLQTI